MNNDTYILLKDFLVNNGDTGTSYPAGTEINLLLPHRHYFAFPNGEMIWHLVVTSNESWFKKKEQEKPKEKDVFVWSDTEWTGIVKQLMCYMDVNVAAEYLINQMNIVLSSKQSKSTPTKIEVIMISLSSKALNYEVSKYEITTSREIPPEKYEQISKAIEQTLNQ